MALEVDAAKDHGFPGCEGHNIIVPGVSEADALFWLGQDAEEAPAITLLGTIDREDIGWECGGICIGRKIVNTDPDRCIGGKFGCVWPVEEVTELGEVNRHWRCNALPLTSQWPS